MSPEFVGRFLPTEPPGKPLGQVIFDKVVKSIQQGKIVFWKNATGAIECLSIYKQQHQQNPYNIILYQKI